MNSARDTTSASPLRDWLVPVGGGLAAGIVAGLFGVGGGVLLVPILVLLLHRSQHVAHATSLVAIAIPAVTGTIRFGLEGGVVWAAALAVAAGAIVGTQVGANILHRVPERELRWAFAVLLLVMAVRLLLAGGGSTGVNLDAPSLTAGLVAAHVAVGLASGTASALLGIGGGAVIVPALVILLGYGQHVAEGTSLAVIVPTALVGAATHARRGYTEWAIGWRLGLGGLLGALIGAEIALSLSASVLSRGFAILLLVVTVLLLRRKPRDPTDGDGDEDAAVSDGDGAQRDTEEIAVPGEDRVPVEPGPGIRIEPLTEDRADDFLAFFDSSAFPDGHPWEGCYCYYDRHPGPGESFDPSDGATNRAAMVHLLGAGLVRGWLAYDGGRPVAWCHATSRVELPHLKVDAPLPDAGRRIGVVACFVVAPTHRRRGVARALLGAVTDTFGAQGMDAVEAYPRREVEDDDAGFRGPLALYLDAGFEITDELDTSLVVRRHLT